LFSLTKSKKRRILNVSKIKNTNQKVNNITYTTNFTNIFGEKYNKMPTTGTYRYDKKLRILFLVDSNIPKMVKDEMENKTEKIRNIKPIRVSKKGLTHVN
jgi:hypothetical protein